MFSRPRHPRTTQVLTYPNVSNVTPITPMLQYNAAMTCAAIKYGMSGMNPPTKYPSARVSAEIQAWLQSGADSRWWKASRNSSSRSWEACRSRVMCSTAEGERPYGAKVSHTMFCVSWGSFSINCFVSRTVVS